MLADIRKLEDTGNSILWRPSNEAFDRLFGKRVVVNNDMPDQGAGNRIIAYGDFSRYRARRAGKSRVVRLNERYADTGQVGFVVIERWDGLLTDTSAVKVLRNLTS